MYRILLLLLVVKSEATIQLGRIPNVIWLVLPPIDNGYINISNITCDQCLCRMLAMNNLTTSIACQQTWKTCQLLFWNATAKLQTDESSVVYFQTIPKFLQTTMNQQSITSSISSMLLTASTVVTTNTITSSTTITSTNNPLTITTTAPKISVIPVTTTAVPFSLINPGGELGSLYPWTPSSTLAPVLNNGMANGANIPPHSGSYAFFGGYGGGSLQQTVLLTNTFSTVQLDSGLLYASISFWERTFDLSPLDTGQVTLIFLSSTKSRLSSVTTGPNNCVLAWCHVIGNWSLPIGTRTIDYVMTFVAHLGGTADVWIDDNSLNVA